MSAFINAAEGLIFIISSIWAYRYYDGQLKYRGKQEERRQEKVKKYGWVILTSACICFFVGLLMFIGSIISIVI